MYKGVLDGLLVREHCLLPVGACEPELRAERSALEDGLTHAEGPGPSLRRLADEVVQGIALQPSQPGERQAWEKRGFGDTDLRVGCDHDLLCLADVRSALQQFRGKAGRNVLGDGLFGQRPSAGNGFGILAEQNTEYVLLLLDLPLQVWDRFGRGVDELLCLAHVQSGVRAVAFKELR